MKELAKIPYELASPMYVEFRGLGGAGAIKWLVELYHNGVTLLEPFLPCASAHECWERAIAMTTLEVVGLATILVLTVGLITTAVRSARKLLGHE